MSRPGAPRSCAECRAAQAGREDPDECWYGREACPYEAFSQHPDLVRIYEFAMRSVETWEATGPGKVKRTQAAISPERFTLALRLYRVPDTEGDLDPRVPFRDSLDAYEWVTVAAKAICDAPNEVTKAVRERREAESQRELSEIKSLMEKHDERTRSAKPA